MPKQSAGILLYRLRERGSQLEVFLVHPGGPFWAKKDSAAWSVPKGEFSNEEDPLMAARREFAEETGLSLDGPLLSLGSLRQSSAKVLHVWAAQGDCDPRAVKSNTFQLEWPPHSGRKTEFPEIDRAEWFSADAARSKLHRGQVELIDRLEAALR